MTELFKIILASGFLIAAGFVLTSGTLSGLNLDSGNCEWEVIEVSGTTFDSLEELENYMGSQEFQDRMDQVENNENQDIEDPKTGLVRYKWCYYEG